MDKPKKIKKARRAELRQIREDWMDGKPLHRIWLLIDQDNGRDGSKNYCWFFPTQRRAKEYKQWHKKLGYAELTGPYLYEMKP